MGFLFFTGLEVAVAGFLLLPIFWMMKKFQFHSTIRTVLYFLFALYLVGVISVVGLPNITYIRFEPNVNLIPFRDMMAGSIATVLNVVMFIPLGFFLPLLWLPYRSAVKTVLFGFSLSLAIELLQMFTFRATDVNDLITNTLGALIGWLLGRLAGQQLPSLAGHRSGKDLAAIFSCVAAIMFFVQPLLLNLIWTYLL